MNQDTHWLRYHIRAAGTSIDGSPHHHLNEGYEGLAWHHTLASISNHDPYCQWPNSYLEHLDLPDASSPNLIFLNGVVSCTICVLKAMRDCYPPRTSSLELRQRWSRASSSFGLIQHCGWTFPWLTKGRCSSPCMADGSTPRHVTNVHQSSGQVGAPRPRRHPPFSSRRSAICAAH